MKSRIASKPAGALWRILSVALVVLTVFALPIGGVAAASDDPPPPTGERFAPDPYDLWSGEFLDFAPPDPEVRLSQAWLLRFETAPRWAQRLL